MRWLHFVVFPPTFVLHRLSPIPFPPPLLPHLLKQNICPSFETLWAFPGCSQQGQDLAGREAEREPQQVKGFHSPVTSVSCHDHRASAGGNGNDFQTQKRALAGWAGAWPHPSELCRAQLVTSHCVTPF